MINSNLKFKPVHSDRLFYDRWHYCVKFYLPEITAIRDTLESEKIRQILQQRAEWRSHARQRWPGLNTISSTGTITEYDVENVVNLAEFLSGRAQAYKIVISVDYAWVYTSDLSLISQIVNLPCVSVITLTQAQITRPRDCVQLRNPQHQWRSYLRSCRLEPQQKENLRQFLQNQTQIRASVALVEWLEIPWRRTQDYYFVDHNGAGFETMLSLVVPQIIRKTLPIMAK